MTANSDAPPTIEMLGPNETKVLIGLTLNRATVVSQEEIEVLVGIREEATGAISTMERDGWLQRIARGRYIFIPPDWWGGEIEQRDVLPIASAIARDGYVGWLAAAARHGLTSITTRDVHVATRHDQKARSIYGRDIRFLRLVDRKLFGWCESSGKEGSYRISTISKTVVDCVDRMDLTGGPLSALGIIEKAVPVVTSAELVGYALRMDSVSLCQRLGYLLELVAPGFLKASDLERLRASIPRAARSAFGNKVFTEGDVGFVPDWGLLVHIPKDALPRGGAVGRKVRRHSSRSIAAKAASVSVAPKSVAPV